jgi:hypothetical protein
MAVIGSIAIQVGADTSALSRGLAKGASEVESFSGRVKGIGSGIAGAFTGIAAGAAALGAGAFLVKSVQAASDLNEQVSKSQQVFGSASATVEADAKRMAEAFGVPRREFLDAASSIGLIAEGAGLSEAAAAKLGSKFGQLGIDISSFFNVSTEEALGALRSGLTGEAEPLKRFGVLMNEDAVKAEAMRLGIAGLNGKLSEAQKVQVRVSLITQGLTKATGDMARTADGAANQMRGFSGRLEELQVAAGEAIAPVTSAFLGLANEGIKAVSEAVLRNQGEIKAWSESAAESIKSVASGTGDLATVWDIVKTAVGGVRSAFIAIEEVAAAIVSEIARAAGKLTDLAALIPGLGPKTGFFDALKDEANALQERYYNAFHGIKDESAKASEAVQRQTTAVQQLGQAAPAATKVAAGMRDMAGAAAKAGADIDKLQAKLKEEVATFGFTSRAADIFKLAQSGASKEAVAQTVALSKQLDALDANKKAMDTMAQDAKSVFEETRTPLEKLQAEISKLQTLFAKGLINKDTLGRGIKAAQDTFSKDDIKGEKKNTDELEKEARDVFVATRSPLEKFQNEMQKLKTLSAEGLIDPTTFARGIDAAKKDLAGAADSGPKDNAALELGSKEARSAVLANRTGGTGDPLKSIDKSGQAQTKLLTEAVGHLRQLARGKGGAPKVLSLTG